MSSAVCETPAFLGQVGSSALHREGVREAGGGRGGSGGSGCQLHGVEVNFLNGILMT